MKLRLIELFSGLGAQAKALENLGIDFEHYKAVEFDKYAMTSYNAIHGTNFETSDITQIKASDLDIVSTDQYTYLMTYSFPCQDLSVAGKQAGMSKGTGTRSGLLWEVERLLNECSELPQILVMENVPQVHGKKNKADFDNWCEFLESKGYTNYYDDLNAKNYGIPQNRNRCFMVSFLDNRDFEFPKPFELKLRLKDMLERKVDEKFYLSDKMIDGFIKHNEIHKEKGTGFIWKPTNSNGVANCLRANASLCPTDNSIIEPSRIGGLFDNEKSKHQAGSIWDKDKIAPTIDTAQGGYRQPLITENLNFRIRKLTPKECWRLMGFDDVDFKNAKNALCDTYYKGKDRANSQLYKQAGNSIVVNVLMEIFKKIFLDFD